MLLIAVLIQSLTQQPRYYRLTTVRQPLRSISWFVLAAPSRLACGPSTASTARLSRLAGASLLTRLPPMPCSYSPRRLAHVPCSS